MAVKPAMKWVPSPNFGYPTGTHGRGGQKPVAIVHHIMEGSLTGTDSHFSNPNSQASTTFGIGKNGEIHQYVDVADAAWGNGRLQTPNLSISWIKRCYDQGVNPNLVTLSIEFEGSHPRDEAGVRTGFCEFTEAQCQAAIALDAWLCTEFGITPGRETIMGHSDLDGVDRPYCPGPNFPSARIIAGLQAALKPAPPPAPEAWEEEFITQLVAAGLLKDRRPAEQPVQWWEFAAVNLRLLERIKALEEQLKKNGAPN